LGNQTTTNSPVPVQVMKTVGGITSPLTGITAVAAGGDFSLALDGNNLVWAWGNNAKGQLGVPSATTTSLTAVQVVGLTGITKIAAGVAHGLALDSTNVLWGWGYNAFGQLGQPVNAVNPSFFTAVKITLPLGTVTEISAGSAHSLALIDGSVYAWGYNFYGQLGNGAALKSETPMLTPQLVVMDLNNTTLPGIKSITAIGFHNIAIDGSGNVWTWGFNGYGQLGDGTTTNRSYAQQVIFQ
jgi:alpha-tubulin suppressor-like RCC1 family protein